MGLGKHDRFAVCCGFVTYLHNSHAMMVLYACVHAQTDTHTHKMCMHDKIHDVLGLLVS